MLTDDVLGGLGQVDETAGQLRRPDHVGPVDVDVLIAGRQPQPVLPELVGGGGRHFDDLDRVAGFLLEIVELRPQFLDVLADGARDQ